MKLLLLNVIVCLFIFLHSGLALQVFPSKFNAEWVTAPALPAKNETILEVAIFCDLECFRGFGFKDNEVIRYWQHLLWDVHMRYKKLPDVNISFRVTSLVILENLIEIGVFQRLLPIRGKLNWFFQEYLQNIAFEMSSYDIPIFSIASDKTYDLHDTTNSTETELCWLDVSENVQKLCPAIISIHKADPSSVLALKIAQILKNTFADDHLKQNSTFNCTANNAPPNNQAFFPPCTNEELSQILHTHQSQFQKKVRIVPLIDTRNLADNGANPLSPTPLTGVSIQEQCQRLAGGNIYAAVHMYWDDTICRRPICYTGASGENGKIPFTPFEWSECSYNYYAQKMIYGRCFRGVCVTPGFRLEHTASGACLGSAESPEVSKNDNTTAAMMKPCSQVSFSPFDLIRLEREAWNHNGALLHTSSTDGADYPQVKVPTKYLTISPENGGIFAKAQFEVENPYRYSKSWEFILAGDDAVWWEQEFVLYHKVSKMCVTADEGSTRVFISDYCSPSNQLARWRFIKEDGSAAVPVKEMKEFVRKDNLYVIEQLVCYMTFNIFC